MSFLFYIYFILLIIFTVSINYFIAKIKKFEENQKKQSREIEILKKQVDKKIIKRVERLHKLHFVEDYFSNYIDKNEEPIEILRKNAVKFEKIVAMEHCDFVRTETGLQGKRVIYVDDHYTSQLNAKKYKSIIDSYKQEIDEYKKIIKEKKKINL